MNAFQLYAWLCALSAALARQEDEPVSGFAPRRPGDHKSDTRASQGRRARKLQAWLLKLKASIRGDAIEREAKREYRLCDQRYFLNDRVAERARVRMQEMQAKGELQRIWDGEIPSEGYLANQLRPRGSRK
jgi:hypothetical protein